jgi:TPR repeat protein
LKSSSVVALGVLVIFTVSSLARADVADGINARDIGDYATALREFRAAAEFDNAEAQFQLGYMYQTGSGVPVDDAQALTWHRKAAQLGHAGAQASLGGIYADGFAVPKDIENSMKWFQMAAERRNALGQLSLGVAYANGQGIRQDHLLAYMWNELIANQSEDEWAQQQAIRLRLVMFK